MINVAAVAALAAAVVLVTAQPGGERGDVTMPEATTSNGTSVASGPQVLGIELERSAPPVVVPPVSTAPAGGDEVALPGGGADSWSLDRNWPTGLTLLALGLAGLGLVAASKPRRRPSTPVGPPSTA